MRTAILSALLVTLAACGGEDDPGYRLDTRSSSPIALAPDFTARLHRTVEATGRHLGIGTDFLRGMTITVQDGWVDCGPDARMARGCVRVDERPRRIVVSLSFGRCIEESPLAHELLHAAIYDPRHEDPRWWNPDVWGPLWDEIRAPDCWTGPPLW